MGMVAGVSLIPILFTQCTIAEKKISIPAEPYFGGTESDRPTLLFPEVINTTHKELNGSFTLNGQHFAYSVDNPAGDHATILLTSLGEENWSTPSIAPFSGVFSDVDPLFSVDGERIYFCSNRPLEPNAPKEDYDIWYVEKRGFSWSDPINPGPPLNSDRDDFYPSSTLDGRIYFTRFDTAKNTDDVHVAIPTPEGYQVENIGDSINTLQGEYDPFVSPYEDYILFTSFREDGLGNGDIYISFREDSLWSEAIHLGPQINTSGRDYCPLITFDQKYFIYTSTVGPDQSNPPADLANLYASYGEVINGNGNIYWCKADWILALGN